MNSLCAARRLGSSSRFRRFRCQETASVVFPSRADPPLALHLLGLVASGRKGAGSRGSRRGESIPRVGTRGRARLLPPAPGWGGWPGDRLCCLVLISGSACGHLSPRRECPRSGFPGHAALWPGGVLASSLVRKSSPSTPRLSVQALTRP